MSTRRRMAARRRVRRQQASDNEVAAWIVGQLFRVPGWGLSQVGHLWAELADHQRRELKGLGLVGLSCMVLVSVLVAGTPLHPVVWWTVGLGWPLLVGGLAVAGALLIHPPKRPPQRLQVVAVAVLAWVLLAILSLASATAGGALGQVGPLLARVIGPGWTALLMAVVASLAVIFAVRLRMSDAIAHATTAAGLTTSARKSPPRGAARRPPAASAATADDEDQVAAVAAVAPAARAVLDDVGDEDDDDELDETTRPAARRSAPVVHDEWVLPQLALLAAPHGRTPRMEAETRRQVARIEAKLAEQKIEAHVIAVNDGPSVTQYVCELGAGVLVKHVLALQNDLSLVLAASPLRIQAPIPGMSAIGIEVPKARRRVVALRELLEADSFSPAGLAVGLGCDVAGAPVCGDLTRAPHLLVAGATGQGKSVFLNALLVALLAQHPPTTLRLVMLDPKRVELAAYNGLPHLAAPVCVEPREATDVLRRAVAEMDRRYKLLASEGVRNIASYNERLGAKGEAPMPYVVIVVDELADLMMVSRAEAQAERRGGCEVEELIVRLAQLARAVGIHLVVATQRPSVDIITGLVKANIPSRVAFTVASGADSRTVLDSVGAEKLLGRGDLLYQPVDGPQQLRLQGAYVEDAEVEAIVEHWRQQGAPDYLSGFVAPEPEASPTT